jgi:glycosyltransferase involved in cell wall biosynthesis
MMPRDKLPWVALVWSQFTAYHVDRCIALARRLEGRADVLGVEVATSSRDYAVFPPSGATGGARKHTLFPGRAFEDVPRWRRLFAALSALRGARVVCIGVPYSQLEFVVLAWMLRLTGRQVVLLCDSKFDDRPRNSGFEFLKRLGLSGFSAVMVAGARGAAYFRSLGFGRRPILFGCDTVDVARIRADAAILPAPSPPDFAARDFVYVGRFVEKKNLSLLIEGFARYCQNEGDSERRLVLVGAGPLEDKLRGEAERLLPPGRVVFTGFLSGKALSGTLAGALGLVLVSHSEQWGLVINEALALGLPVIVSESPGARDLLVRDGVNGYVVETGSAEALALAMQRLGADRSAWEAMSQASLARAPLGDVANFADSVELLIDPAAQPAGERAAAYRAQCEELDGAAAQA